MENELNQEIPYEELRQIIFDYYKETYGIQLSSISIDYLPSKLRGSDYYGPFFGIHEDFGETSFDISNEDVFRILKAHLAKKGQELTDIEYGYNVRFKYKNNPEIAQKVEPVNLDISYDCNMDYTTLRQIIFDYYKEIYGVQISSVSIDYLQSKLNGSDPRPFFGIPNDLGETRFDISNEDILRILKNYLARKGRELTDIKYDNGVRFKYKNNPEIAQKVEPFNLDITYNCNMDYTTLRQIIFDYYKETKGIQLQSASIDYLKFKLMGNDDPRPFFLMHDEKGEEIWFDLSNEEILEILKLYLSKRNYEFVDVKYGYHAEIKYKKKNQQKETVNTNDAVKKDEDQDNVALEEQREINSNEPKKETLVLNDIPKETQPYQPTKINIKRKFKILKKEKAMNKAQQAKKQSALMAGVCILGAIVAIHFTSQDPNVIIKHELDTIYSWEALVQYFRDLGPLVTSLAVGAGTFVSKYLLANKKFKKARQDLMDYVAMQQELEAAKKAENGGRSI